MNKKTKEYILDVRNYLTKLHGEVKAEWEAPLELLADNMELYKQCQESIKQNGIFDPTTGKKNPLLSTMKDLQATILKQMQHFGLSPYANAKIKLTESDETEDFIEELTRT
jgi:phage terminase, small subunit|nr:MAG TPA: terminase small subunit [Caudoviricetes sp.]DAU06753.1 MAG TPA: terminase small subunit [Caudoviricetes sp.]